MNKYFFVLLTSLLYGICLCSCHGKKEEIPMQEYGGVYKVPCIVNDVPMDFIFDTGASSVCISLTEANFLYRQGKLSDKDFIGISYSQIANGDVVPNASVVLRKIEIGDLELRDVDAIITLTSDAPLLLGQSAIQRLGIIEIDGDILRITKPHPKMMTSNEWESYYDNHFWIFVIIWFIIITIPLISGLKYDIKYGTINELTPGLLILLIVLWIVSIFIFTYLTLPCGAICIEIINGEIINDIKQILGL